MPHLLLKERFEAANAALPLIAILRGLTPDSAGQTGQCLYAAGFRLIEVPLNSPEPFVSIATLRRSLPADALVGAGTVLGATQMQQLKDCGGELAVMPHCDPALIRQSKQLGMLCIPGVATPSEAFTALAAGADALKLFPAELMTPTILTALRVVLPQGTWLSPVGGITPDSLRAYHAAGARGFGLGSALFTPGISLEQLAGRAKAFVEAWAALSA